MSDAFNIPAEDVEEHAALLISLALSMRAGYLEAQRDPGADFRFRLTEAGRKYVESMGAAR